MYRNSVYTEIFREKINKFIDKKSKRKKEQKHFMRTHYTIENINLIPKRNRTKTKTHLSDERTELSVAESK